MMEGSEIGNGVKKNQAACAVSVGLLQPSECAIGLAKLRINLGQFDGQIFLVFRTLRSRRMASDLSRWPTRAYVWASPDNAQGSVLSTTRTF